MMVCVDKEDSICLESQHKNNPLAEPSCTQQMLLFQTPNHAFCSGFEFAMCGPGEPRRLFLLNVTYVIGSHPRVEDWRPSILCQPLICL